MSKIHTSAPTHARDLKRYADKKFTSKDQRNQYMTDAFYQGGHSQTAIALAFGVSSSTVREMEIAEIPLPRHCERSVAIHATVVRDHGSPRFARDDGRRFKVRLQFRSPETGSSR